MVREVITTKLGNIEYSSVGEGIPIVFIHGGHSNCNDALSQKGIDLEQYQLITPSRPGYGKTPLNNNKTPKQAADLVMELIKYLSLEKTIVYGISAGGLTAIELAANYPNKVKKLILASAVSKKWLSKDGKTYKTAQRLFNPKIEKVTWTLVKIFSRVFPTMIAKSFYPQFSSNSVHILDKRDISELVCTLSFYKSQNGFLNDIDQNIESSTISRINCPTLIIHSKNDNSVLFEHAIHSKNEIFNSKLIELDNEWGHLLWIGNDSNFVLETINEFIKD